MARVAGALKGCFEKLEAKNDGPCLTFDDTTPMENDVDGFVSDVVQALDPGYPTPALSACSSAKKKCVAKKVKALLKCHEKAVKAVAQAVKDDKDADLTKALTAVNATCKGCHDAHKE